MAHSIAKLVAIASFALVSTARADEVVTIHRHVPQPARQISRDPRELPPYSAAAITSNVWARAWMLLEIDATGAVTRTKLLHAPGHDLEAIAVSRALATRFSPARDGDGNAVPSQLVWGLEWPAYSWLREHFGTTSRMPRFGADPGELPLPPCAGSGPLVMGSAVSKVYRDCATPDLQAAQSTAWVYPKTAIASSK